MELPKLSLEKIYSAFTLAIRLTLLAAGVGAYVSERWQVLFVTCFALLLTFVPFLLRKQVRIHFPVEFELLIVAFVYASLFLGDVHGYYTRFWWWDIVLHSGSAIVLGLIGFLIMYVLLEGKKITASPIITALFAFCFALAIGALWEIAEFGIDQIFLTNMQKSGLLDTMGDLITDAVGALLTSIVGWLYLRGKKYWVFDSIIRRFIEQNPRLFK